MGIPTGSSDYFLREVRQNVFQGARATVLEGWRKMLKIDDWLRDQRNQQRKWLADVKAGKFHILEDDGCGGWKDATQEHIARLGSPPSVLCDEMNLKNNGCSILSWEE
jgi:hypothetical protein